MNANKIIEKNGGSISDFVKTDKVEGPLSKNEISKNDKK